ELVEGGAGGARAAGLQGAAHRALAAAGEDEPLPVRGLRERRQAVVAAALLPRGEVRLGDGAGQAAVALRSPGQGEEVGAGRVHLAGGALGGAEGELGTDDGGQPDPAGGLGEADDA